MLTQIDEANYESDNHSSENKEKTHSSHEEQIEYNHGEQEQYTENSTKGEVTGEYLSDVAHELLTPRYDSYSEVSSDDRQLHSRLLKALDLEETKAANEELTELFPESMTDPSNITQKTLLDIIKQSRELGSS